MTLINKLINNPFVALPSVALTVFGIIAGAEYYSGQRAKEAYLAGLEKTTLKNELRKELSELEAEEKEQESGVPKSLKTSYQSRIYHARDNQALNKLWENIRKDSLKIVEKEGNKAFEDLSKLIQTRITDIQENKKEEPNNNNAAPILLSAADKQAQALLQNQNFEEGQVDDVLDLSHGLNPSIRKDLELYKKICQHKKDYQHLLTELRKLPSNSYFEKSERLTAKRFKSISIDDFEEANQWFLDNKPLWMSPQQQAIISAWWDEIDEEIERLDLDY